MVAPALPLKGMVSVPAAKELAAVKAIRVPVAARLNGVVLADVIPAGSVMELIVAVPVVFTWVAKKLARNLLPG